MAGKGGDMTPELEQLVEAYTKAKAAELRAFGSYRKNPVNSLLNAWNRAARKAVNARQEMVRVAGLVAEAMAREAE
jgi:hypothetical protein